MSSSGENGAVNPTLLDSTDRLNEIVAYWKVVQYGQNDIFGLECTNNQYGEKTFTVRLPKQGGLGLDLLEVSKRDPRHGLVVINEIIPDSNAANAKVFQIGDALISISGQTPTGNITCNLQGLNFDSTLAELQKFSDSSEVVIVARRLIKRKNVLVKVYGPKGMLSLMFVEYI